jgi:folate-binding protein YgfZ
MKGIEELQEPDENARVPTLAERLAAARAGAAFGPPIVRGILRVTGSKRLDFLNRMSTQKLTGLAPGEAAYTAFLDGKARVLGEGMALVRDQDVLLDVDPAAAPGLRAHLQKYVLRDDVKIADVDPDLRVATLFGPPDDEVVRTQYEVLPRWRGPLRGAPALDVVVPEFGWDWLRHAMTQAGALRLQEGDLEILRVLAGVPRWGAEIDEGRLVMEAALTESAVSFDKGCYLGQEIVLRGTFRGQVQRGLVQLDLPAGAGPGATLRRDGQEVGQVTSAVDAPEGRVGLGYLRRAFWERGARVETDGGEAVVRRALVQEKD